MEAVDQQLVEKIKKLATKKGRKQAGLFLVEGRLQIQALLASDYQVEAIYSVDGSLGQQISAETARQISQLYDPQEFFAMAKLPEQSPTITKGQWLLLDGVQDPGNLGTLLRTANAMKLTGVALTQRAADLYSDKVLRAAKGANFKLQMITDVQAADLIKTAKQQGLYVYGTIINQTAKPLAMIEKKSDDFLLILGNEGIGVDKNLAELIDQNINIEMAGDQDSLNVAIAGGILIYELSK